MKTKLELSNNSQLWRNLSFGLIGLWLISAAALFSGLVPLPLTEIKGQRPGIAGQMADIGYAGNVAVANQGQPSDEDQAYRALVTQTGKVEQSTAVPKPAPVMASQDHFTSEGLDEPASQLGVTGNSLNSVLGQAQPQPTVVAQDKPAVSSREDSLKDELRVLGLALADLKNLLEDMNMQMSQIRATTASIEPVTTQPEALPSSEMTEDKQYTVKKGDVLSGIAADLKLKTGCLIAWNSLSYPYVIDVDQKLTLSGPKDSCIPTKIWIAPYSRLAETDRINKPVQIDKLSELKIIGMSGRHLVLAADDGSPVSMYTLGELIEGMGTLQSIDLAKRQARTSNGIVLQADLSP